MAATMARRGRPQANEDDDFVQMPPPDLGSKLIVRTPNGSVYSPEEASYVPECEEEVINREKREVRPPKRYTPGDVLVGGKKKKQRINKPLKTEKERGTEELRGPFTEDPEEMPDSAKAREIENFLGKGLLRSHMRETGRKYLAAVDSMDPEKYTALNNDQQTMTKSWYYTLYYSWAWLTDSHIEVAFYFLRMKGIQFKSQQRYTTTDPMFLHILNRLCTKYADGKMSLEDAARNSNIVGTVMGKVEYGRAWREAEYVYMPLCNASHWTLLVLDVTHKVIRVYDSNVRNNKTLKNVRGYLLCLKTLLGKIMKKLGVYGEGTEVEQWEGDLQVEGVRNCPQQDDGSNCGIFVIKMAEYLMLGKDVSNVDVVRVNDYRSKMAVELMTYAEKTK